MCSQRRSQFEHDHRRRVDRALRITATIKASRDAGDGLTGTYSGGSLNLTESVPKWSQDCRARVGLRESFTLSGHVVDLYNHINAEILINVSDRVAQGELHITSSP